MAAEKLVDELRENERVIEMELERLREFSNHPFKVNDDSQMAELQDSISRNRILNPLIIRPMSDGAYEIISGHRRKYAAEKLGYRKVPVIIRYRKNIYSLFLQWRINRIPIWHLRCCTGVEFVLAS